jgi:hypothetical protein
MKTKELDRRCIIWHIEDLCTFIMKEAIPVNEKYHNATGTLARPEFRVLTKNY